MLTIFFYDHDSIFFFLYLSPNGVVYCEANFNQMKSVRKNM